MTATASPDPGTFYLENVASYLTVGITLGINQCHQCRESPRESYSLKLLHARARTSGDISDAEISGAIVRGV